MFCPVCKVEYRLGFTQCSDCNVPLVEYLTNMRDTSVATRQAIDVDLPELLWSGVDPRPFAAIRQALDSANIPYNDERYEASLLGILPRPPLVIWIRMVDHERAQQVLTDIFGDGGDDPIAAPTNEAGSTQGEHLSPSAESIWATELESLQPVAHELAGNFYPEDATAEVWSGDEPGMAEILEDCLRENGIGCAVDQTGVKSRILVLPNAEVRAREIIREVIEATPPE
jgi:hypothetical protein